MLNHLWAVVVVLATALTYQNEAAKILVIFPLPGPSHGILGTGYVDNLLKAGHEVTYITPYPRKNLPANLHEIEVKYPDEVIPKNMLNITAILNKELDTTDSSIVFFMVHELSKIALRSEAVKNLLNDKTQTFDVVIVDWMFAEIYAGFSAVFQAPLIWSSSLDPHWLILRLVDEAPNPAYLADYSSNNVPPLTFFQRIYELWMQIKTTVVRLYLRSSRLSLYDEVFVTAAENRGITIPPLQVVQYNASLVLSNSHVSLGEPVKLPQNFIPIGGYHIDLKPKPLPEDLKKIMDNSKNGVIYFSMGSNLQSKNMPPELKRDFLKMFGQLKQTVLWKFEENSLADVPKNVHILNWAPQQSILDHPNCVLFITHGGLLSTTETVHYGVPIVGIPVFADQFTNVDRAVIRGIAKRVDLSYDTPKELKKAIEEVTSNPSYRERVKYYSSIYHDRPVTPHKELVHWVEHTIRTKGALHLRSRALQLSWYQKMYLDFAALIAVILVAICYALKCIFKSKKRVSHKKFD